METPADKVRNDGMMESWNNGETRNQPPSCYVSIFPLFHHSNIPGNALNQWKPRKADVPLS